jgi:hypothetical protein
MDRQEQIQALAAVFYSHTTCFLWELGTPEKDTDNVSKYLQKVIIEQACKDGYHYVDFLGSYSKGLAEHKKRYGVEQTPMVEYQKRYSTMRYILEVAPPALKYLVSNPKYLWSRLTHR